MKRIRLWWKSQWNKRGRQFFFSRGLNTCSRNIWNWVGIWILLCSTHAWDMRPSRVGLCPSIIGGQCSHVKWRQVQGSRLYDLNLMDDGGQIPKSPRRGGRRFDSWLWNLLSTWHKLARWSTASYALALAYWPSVSKWKKMITPLYWLMVDDRIRVQLHQLVKRSRV